MNKTESPSVHDAAKDYRDPQEPKGNTGTHRGHSGTQKDPKGPREAQRDPVGPKETQKNPKGPKRDKRDQEDLKGPKGNKMNSHLLFMTFSSFLKVTSRATLAKIYFQSFYVLPIKLY